MVTGKSNVRHIRGILPVVYKQRVMDLSTKTANEIMFATGNANKLREVCGSVTEAPCSLWKWSSPGQKWQGMHLLPCVAPSCFGLTTDQATQPRCYILKGLLRLEPWLQVIAILEAGHPLPFTVKAANLDLPELQGEPLEIAKEKCRLAAQQVR